MPLKTHAIAGRRLEFAYKSAWAIIIVLVIIAQAIIQLTLHQEVVTRELATTLSRQELRSQRLLRNSLLLFSDPSDAAINPPGVDPVAQMQQDIVFLEGTHARLTSEDVPRSVSEPMRKLQHDFDLTDVAAHDLLRLKDSQDNKAKMAALTQVFIHEQLYLSGTFAVYTTLTQQADAQVTAVRLIEIALFVITCATLIVEALAIIRPAVADYKRTLHMLMEIQIKKEKA